MAACRMDVGCVFDYHQSDRRNRPRHAGGRFRSSSLPAQPDTKPATQIAASVCPENGLSAIPSKSTRLFGSVQPPDLVNCSAGAL